jgi:hypothetical protein
MTLRAAIRALLDRRTGGDRPETWLVVRSAVRESYAAVPAGVLSRATLEWCDVVLEIDETSLAETEAKTAADDLVEYLAGCVG